MLHKAGWAMGIVFVLAQVALGQTPEQPDKLAPPQPSGMKLDGPGAAGTAPLVFEPGRRSSLFYVEADYLLWWVNHGPAPALLTTAPDNGISRNVINNTIGLN